MVIVSTALLSFGSQPFVQMRRGDKKHTSGLCMTREFLRRISFKKRFDFSPNPHPSIASSTYLYLSPVNDFCKLKVRILGKSLSAFFSIIFGTMGYASRSSRQASFSRLTVAETKKKEGLIFKNVSIRVLFVNDRNASDR
jgi:hypothetical protein